MTTTPTTHHQHHFEDLSPDDFERLVYYLVKRSGEFDEVQWYGGARDRGRDVVAYKHTVAGREKWYIQCKRYRSITFSTLRDELDKLALYAQDQPDFAPDVVVFATACPVPAQARDKAGAHARALDLPEPYYWGRLELDERLKAQPETGDEFFGALTLTDTRLQHLRRDLQAGKITLATGERAVALGQSATDALIVTGDGNVVLTFKGADAATIRQVLMPLLPLHQLPRDLDDFTGREDEIRHLLALLGEGGGERAAAISAIGGMGGVGKSALAVHVTHRLTGCYPDAQIVVDMRGVSERPLTPIEAMAHIIRAFHPVASLPDDLDQVAALYRTTLAGRRALILLDDAASAAQVRPLLPPPPCGLIVTSRRTLVLAGLRCLNLDALSEDEARDLLHKILGENGGDGEDGGRATVAELDAIARLCGRLPLALRVAGSFLAVHPDWPPAEYARALSGERERLARLVHEDLDVEAALGLSAAQLARERPGLAVRWQALSVFPAPFDRAAAAAVWAVEEGQARDGLSELLARSLLLYDAEAARYRLHDLMRPVARNAFGYGGGQPDLATQAERLGQAAARHAAHYLEVGRQANDLYEQGGDHVLEGLSRFDAAWPHLQAAYARMQRREEQEQDDKAAARWLSDLPGRMPYVLDLRLPPREKIPILEAARSTAHRLGDREAEEVHLGNLGLAYRALGEVARAIEYHEQALTISREIGDRRGEGADLGSLGLAYSALGEVARAIEYYEQALTIAREIGDRRGEGAWLGNLGLAYSALGEVARAIEYHQQALTIAREIGDRRNERVWCWNLGLLYEESDPIRAADLMQVCVDYERQIGHPDAEPDAQRVRALRVRSTGQDPT